MAKPFWNETFAWVDDGELEEYVIEIEATPPAIMSMERFGKVASVGLLVGTVVALSSIAGAEFFHRGPSRADRLSAMLETKRYAPSAQASFKFLTDLSPKEIDATSTKSRQELGQNIQNAAVNVSLAAFRQGLDNKGEKVDMYDIATQLIPESTQAVLATHGFEFVGEEPVNCSADAPNGDHGYDPLDYSNHPPQDFKVEHFEANGRQKTLIPLGTEEMYTVANPANTLPFERDISLPCVTEYPHKTYPPNGATYPDDKDFVVLLY